MDGSDTRRGLPAVHRRFAALHRGEDWHGDPEAFGCRRRDPARRPLPDLGRRDAQHLRPAGGVAAGPAGLRRDAHRAHGRAVPRPARAGPRWRVGRARAAGRPLQDREVHDREAAAPRRRPCRCRAGGVHGLLRLRAAARRGLPAARRRARRLRRPRRPASPPATTCARASAPPWSRWRSRPRLPLRQASYGATSAIRTSTRTASRRCAVAATRRGRQRRPLALCDSGDSPLRLTLQPPRRTLVG